MPPPQKNTSILIPKPVTIILYGENVFLDMIELRILR